MILSSTPGIAGGTHIQTSDGIRAIFPVSTGRDDDFTIVSNKDSLHFGKSLHPATLTYTGIKPTIKINTSAGKCLIGSYRHQILVLDTIAQKVEYVPLAKITRYHHLIGVVTNNNPTSKPIHIPTFIPYMDFLALPLPDQMDYVAFRVQQAKCLSLRLPSHLYAQALAAVAALMGCYSQITYLPTSGGSPTKFFVNLTPLSDSSILSQLVDPDHCSYDQCIADGCRGDIMYSMEYPRSDEASETIKLAEEGGGTLYSDQVTSADADVRIPLYVTHVPPIHAFIGDGYIQRGSTAPAAN
jgi:hypothetical protein